MQMNEATLFGHAKVRDLSGSTGDMNRTLERLGACSSESDLAVNVAKKKWMLVCTPQFFLYHSLHEKQNYMSAMGRPWGA